MALTPPANTDMATMQALERVEERLVALYSAQGTGLRAEIESSALRTRLWTIGIVITAQVAGVGYLTLTLG